MQKFYLGAEATSYPFWVVVDPGRGSKEGGIRDIKGLFFSRKSAEDWLKARDYRFSKKAYVFCFSGGETDWEKYLRSLPEEQKMQEAYGPNGIGEGI